MKSYKPGILYHNCSNLMRLGKPVKVYQYTPGRRKCPNCGRMISIWVEKERENAN